jgi:N2227-like protein
MALTDIAAWLLSCSLMTMACSKVRSTLHQCVRDWSDDGANERALSYGPIIDELQLQLPVTDANINKQVSKCDTQSVQMLVK